MKRTHQEMLKWDDFMQHSYALHIIADHIMTLTLQDAVMRQWCDGTIPLHVRQEAWERWCQQRWGWEFKWQQCHMFKDAILKRVTELQPQYELHEVVLED